MQNGDTVELVISWGIDDGTTRVLLDVGSRFVVTETLAENGYVKVEGESDEFSLEALIPISVLRVVEEDFI